MGWGDGNRPGSMAPKTTSEPAWEHAGGPKRRPRIARPGAPRLTPPGEVEEGRQVQGFGPGRGVDPELAQEGERGLPVAQTAGEDPAERLPPAGEEIPNQEIEPAKLSGFLQVGPALESD